MAVRASVAMAVYNGEKYLPEQLDSILADLGPTDELVISYDRSEDGTLALIEDYAARDPRIRIVMDPGSGVRSNFNNAIVNCRGTYIFLSDQDDVWLPGKADTMVALFEETGALVAAHDGYMTDEKLNILPGKISESFGESGNFWRNWVRCTFWGGCVAFRASFREVVCPIPESGATHDVWISLMGCRHGKTARSDGCFLLHRWHGENVSSMHRRALKVIARERAQTLRNVYKREWELKHKHKEKDGRKP